MVLWRDTGAGASLPRRLYRRWGLAAVVSLVLHVLGGPPALQRILHPPERELEVTYVSLDDPSSPTQAASSPEEPAPEEEEKPPEPERRKPTEKPPEKKPDPVVAKPLEVVPLPNLPMVDQDQFPDDQDNPEARFLAQNNHRAAEDVQAKDRSLDKAAPPPSPPEATPANPLQPPAPEARTALAAAPPPAAQQPQPASGRRDEPLAMRGAPGPSVGEALPSEPGGTTVVAGTQDSQVGRAGGPQKGASQLSLSHQQYDEVVGRDLAQKERRQGALAEVARVPNRWDRLVEKQNAIRSALENFLPNVRVGNQSELGTRKHPFAAFITTMHRQIHRYWGDGFLADLDRKTGQDAYPTSLETAIEIAVRSDGTLAGTVFVRNSGSLPFDTAALDAVLSAAPFPEPPAAIKSRDGNVYLTWHFHRDERQCHPNYVDMHILTTPPKVTAPLAQRGGKAPDKAPEKPQEGSLLRGPGSGLAAAGAAAGTGANSKKNDDGGSSAAASKQSAAETSVPSAAREAAERWLAAFHKGDIGWLSSLSGLPFTAGGKPVADDGAALRAFYRELVSEESGRSQGMHFYTATQIRTRLGRMPPGADEPDMAFAYIDLRGEDILLLLAPTDRGWSIVGLNRQ